MLQVRINLDNDKHQRLDKDKKLVELDEYAF